MSFPLFAPAGDAPVAERERVDWSQLWCPGPRRVFTDAELARAGTDRPSRTFLVMAAIVALLLAQVPLQRAPAAELPGLLALLLVIAAGTYQGGMALWWQPTRRRLAWLTVAANAACLFAVVGLKWRFADADARVWLSYTSAAGALVCSTAWWFAVVFRSQQIAGRLRAFEERDRALELARQLATAQVKPHFLFNTLASLQHWVDTRDERAGPMLAALTAYLRATLPLFDKPALTLAQELEAVRRYLDVMRARWGERLQHEVHADPAVLGAMLPPGALLTLVENAVDHGAGAKLAGGTVQVVARSAPGARVQVDVCDDGPGLPAGAPPEAGHLGLANTRMRLAQAHGAAARLTLENRPEGGCLARLEWPQPAPGAAP